MKKLYKSKILLISITAIVLFFIISLTVIANFFFQNINQPKKIPSKLSSIKKNDSTSIDFNKLEFTKECISKILNSSFKVPDDATCEDDFGNQVFNIRSKEIELSISLYMYDPCDQGTFTYPAIEEGKYNISYCAVIEKSPITVSLMKSGYINFKTNIPNSELEQRKDVLFSITESIDLLFKDISALTPGTGEYIKSCEIITPEFLPSNSPSKYEYDEIRHVAIVEPFILNISDYETGKLNQIGQERNWFYTDSDAKISFSQYDTKESSGTLGFNFTISDDSKELDRIEFRHEINSIQAVYNCTFHTPQLPGKYTITITADPDNHPQIPEDSNGIFQYTFQTTSKNSDTLANGRKLDKFVNLRSIDELQLHTSDGYLLENGSAKPGDVISIAENRIANASNIKTTEFEYEFYYEFNGKTVTISKGKHDSIDPDGYGHAYTDWKIPAEKGEYTIFLKIDPDNKVEEWNEKDNIISKKITI